MPSCPISVAIPTYRRTPTLLSTLAKLLACDPAPAEVIVHVDANDATSAAAVIDAFPRVRVVQSAEQAGPGGGRNLAIQRAANPIVASFDDDSYPIDPDYFARLMEMFSAFPDAGVISASIYHLGEPVLPDHKNYRRVADFIGCGCAYRRDVFLKTTGYVRLPLAYGMEEIDLALRLHAMGFRVVQSRWLRVLHDTRLEHHLDPRITAASVSNALLMAYLRYPLHKLWIGGAQCANRVAWLVRNGRRRGIMRGLLAAPGLIWQHRRERAPVMGRALSQFLTLRRERVDFEEWMNASPSMPQQPLDHAQ